VIPKKYWKLWRNVARRTHWIMNGESVLIPIHSSSSLCRARRRRKCVCGAPTPKFDLMLTTIHRKFIDTYGMWPFLTYYYPKYEQLGEHCLPRLQFDKGPAAKKKKGSKGCKWHAVKAGGSGETR
jgi:hypothetical protein